MSYKTIDGEVEVKDVSFTVKGESFGIVGESGVEKLL